MDAWTAAHSADYQACVMVDVMAVRWVDLLDASTAVHSAARSAVHWAASMGMM